MSIAVTCQCGRRFAAQARLAGRRVRCPACGAPISVPGGAARPSAAAGSAQAGLVVQCQCGSRFHAEPHLAGKTVRCPTCGGPMPIPAASSAAGAAAQAGTSAPQAQASTPQPDAPGPLPADLGLDQPAAAVGPGPISAGLGQPIQPVARRLWVGRALVAGFVAGALLLLGLAGWGTVVLVKKVAELIEPPWEPDAALVSQLQPEQRVGEYAIRPLPTLERKRPYSDPDQPNRWAAHWTDGRYEIMMCISFDRDPGNRSLTVSRVARKLAAGLQRQSNGPVQTAYGRIGQLHFARVSYAAKKADMTQMDVAVSGPFNCQWITLDGDTLIRIQVASAFPLDSPKLQLAETSARTFRKLPVDQVAKATQAKGRWRPSPASTSPGLPAGAAAGARADSSADKTTGQVAKLPVRILLGSDSAPILYASGNGPYALINRQTVYDLRSGRPVATLPQNLLHHGAPVALSHDGSVLALCTSTAEQGGIELYETGTFKQLHQLRYDRAGRMLEIVFPNPSKLTALFPSRVLVWNAATGTKTVAFEAPPHPRQRVLSADGRLLAVAAGEQVLVFDTETGYQVARTEQPRLGQAAPLGACDQLAFSPDASLLAGLYGSRIVCWDNRGQIVFDGTVAQNRRPGQSVGRKLRWIPGGRGWFLYRRYLLDRDSKRVVAIVREPLEARAPCGFLDADHLMVVRGKSSRSELIVLEIPWPQIDGSLRQMKAGKGLLRPGASASLSVEVGQTRFGDKKQIVEIWQTALTELLKAKGIGVAAGAPIILRAEYSEQTGKSLKYTETQRPSPLLPGRKTGRTAVLRETIGTLHVALVARGQKEPKWERKVQEDAAYFFAGQATDANLRDAMLRNLASSLRSIDDLPFFLPATAEHVALPVVCQLGSTTAGPVAGEGPSRPWLLSPDPAPTGDVQPAARLQLGHADLVKVVSPSGDPGRAFVAEGNLPGFERQIRIGWYNLRTGRLLASAVVPSTGALLDASPDGHTVLVKRPATAQADTFALELWSFEEGQPEARKIAWWQPSGQRPIRGGHWGAIIATNRVITVSQIGKQLTLWQLPEARRVYAITWPAERVLGLSPGRKYLLAYDDAKHVLHFYETATGQLVGELGPMPADYVGLQGVAFRKDGAVLAACFSTAAIGTKRLVCWDLRTGSRMADLEVPLLAGLLQWCGPDRVAAGNYLVDIRRGAVVWRFRMVKPVKAELGDRFWFLHELRGHRVLGAENVPSDAAEGRIQMMLAARVPIIRRGDKLSLDIQFRATPPDAQFRERFEQHVRDQLQTGRYQVEPGQPVTFQVLVEDKKAGETLTYEVSERRSPGDVRTQQQKVANRALVTTLIIQRGSAQGEWRRSLSVGVRSFARFDGSRASDFATKLLNERWETLEALVSQLSLPDAIWPTGGLEGYGESGFYVEHRRQQTKRIAAPPPKPSNWTAMVDPMADDQPLPLKRSIRLSSGRVESLCFAAPSVGQAMLLFQERARGRRHTWLLRYNLAARRLLESVPAGDQTQLLDLRPDGRLALLGHGRSERMDAVDIWSLGETGHETLLNWNPYAGVSRSPSLHSAMFIGQRGLLTLRDDQVDLWILPDRKHVYTIPWPFGSRGVLSPSRRFLVTFDRRARQLQVYDTASGQRINEVNGFSDSYSGIEGGAFSADGKQLATVFSVRDGRGPALVVWNTQTGEPTHMIRMPGRVPLLQWCSDKYLLAGSPLAGSSLVHLDYKSIVWFYPGVLPRPDLPGTRGVGLVSDRSGAVHLASWEVPSSQVTRAITKVAESVGRLLEPGAGINVVLADGSVPPDEVDLATELTELLGRRAEASMLQVDPSAATTLRLTVKDLDSAIEEPLVGHLGDGTIFPVPCRRLDAKLEIVDGQGQTHWEVAAEFAVDPQQLELADSGDRSPADAVLMRRWKRLARWLEQVHVPETLCPWERTRGIGRSRLSPGGEQIEVHQELKRLSG